MKVWYDLGGHVKVQKVHLYISMQYSVGVCYRNHVSG